MDGRPFLLPNFITVLGDQQLEGSLETMKRYFFFLSLSLTVIFLDQWTKALVRSALAVGESWVPITALPFFRIVHWYNRGAAFGLFQNGGSLFIVLAILVGLAILYYYPRLPEEDWLLHLALGLQFSGAIGNLIDRLYLGKVTDFIAVGNFPIFNLADSSITIGTALLLFGSWLHDRRKEHESGRGEQKEGADGCATP